jgi:hypothetical protein
MTWVYRNGACVEKYGPLDIREPPARSALPCPNIISDVLHDLRGAHDGKYYSSKSELRRSYREGGYIELGNDAPKTTVDNTRRLTKDEIGQALRKVKDGYKPAPLETTILPPDAE